MKTLSDRLRERRKKLKLTQKQLSQAVGVSHVTVSQWESSDTSPNGENLFKLASALRCHSSWLLKGGELHQVNEVFLEYIVNDGVNQQIINNQVPVISWLQALDWSQNKPAVLSQVKQWRGVTSPVGQHAFALCVNGDSMTNPFGSPSIPAGSIVIIDPDIEPSNGAIVVACVSNNEEATLKKLIIDGAERLLKPLNPEFKTISVDKHTRIIGVATKVEMDL